MLSGMCANRPAGVAGTRTDFGASRAPRSAGESARKTGEGKDADGFDGKETPNPFRRMKSIESNLNKSAPMIRLNGLCMHYTLGASRIDILRDVDLCIAGGERVAIAGPSGSGKTSLLLLLAGLERPASGSVEFDGVRLDDHDNDRLADLRRDHMGIVFQSFHLVPSLTALDNAALPLEIAGRRDARSRARALLEQVGLGARLTHYPGQLSGGEQQRVAIARALVHRPKLVLADEPTGNLDDRTGAAIGELLLHLNAESNTTLVWVTHDLAFARRCDRVLRLAEGRLTEWPLEREHDDASAA